VTEFPIRFPDFIFENGSIENTKHKKFVKINIDEGKIK
jgi:hypothetical protein